MTFKEYLIYKSIDAYDVAFVREQMEKVKQALEENCSARSFKLSIIKPNVTIAHGDKEPNELDIFISKSADINFYTHLFLECLRDLGFDRASISCSHEADEYYESSILTLTW